MSLEIVIAIVLMILLFLRQISVLKETNKINYAPIILGIGIIFSLLHFILDNNANDVLLTFKESLVTVIVGTLLFMVINVLQQTRQNELLQSNAELYLSLGEQFSLLKESLVDIETKIIQSLDSEKVVIDESRDRFRYDIKALESIAQNQLKIMERFDMAATWHKEIVKLIQNLTQKELPSFDEIVHKHIDLLRIEEQEHFNKLRLFLQKALENKTDVKADVEALKESMLGISKIASSISSTIISQTKGELFSILDSFDKGLSRTLSNAQGIDTKLYESENRLSNIKENSEIIMRQMVLSSKKMVEIEKQSEGFDELIKNFSELLVNLDGVRGEYVQSQSTLFNITKELEELNSEYIIKMKGEVNFVVQKMSDKVDEIILKLERGHNLNEDLSQNFKILTKKSQLKSSYLDLES